MTNDEQSPSGAEDVVALRRLKDRAVENSVLLKEVTARCQGMANENEELKRLLERVQRSFSWRITAPLRAAGGAVRLVVRAVRGKR